MARPSTHSADFRARALRLVGEARRGRSMTMSGRRLRRWRRCGNDQRVGGSVDRPGAGRWRATAWYDLG